MTGGTPISGNLQVSIGLNWSRLKQMDGDSPRVWPCLTYPSHQGDMGFLWNSRIQPPDMSKPMSSKSASQTKADPGTHRELQQVLSYANGPSELPAWFQELQKCAPMRLAGHDCNAQQPNQPSFLCEHQHVSECLRTILPQWTNTITSMSMWAVYTGCSLLPSN